jgi:DNA-binding transcriptional ArsR family regulator
MVERDEEADLTAVLKAAGDAVRRRILTLLVRDGPMRVTDLARSFEMSLNAVSKHIKVLEAAGLVSRSRDWREHFIRARPERLQAVARWMEALGWVWDVREDRRQAAPVNPPEE